MVSASGYGRDDNVWDGADELALTNGDERLPWLQSGEEDEQDTGGFDTGRMVMLGLVALLALLAALAAVWYFTNSGSVGEPEADGSVIVAPEAPYKARPDDTGGKTFAGTGDTSFAVGEGQTREGQLASKPVDTAPKPSIATTLDKPAETPKPEPKPAQVSGVGVQVGAFPRREDAEAGWAALIRQTEALSGVSHRVVEGQADIGRVFRLQAVAGDRASAQRLCDALKADGLACFVK